MSPDDYDIVSVTPSTGDAAIIATPVNIDAYFKNKNKRVTLGLINQYDLPVTCTISVKVGFLRK